MADPGVIVVDFMQNQPCTLMARVEKRALAPNARGVPYKQADVASMTITVYDASNPIRANWAVVAGFNGLALTVANVVFNTLQPWDGDRTGVNLIYTIAGSAFPTANAKYRVEATWTLTDGTGGVTRWEGTAWPT